MSSNASSSSSFFVMFNGQIKSAHFPSSNINNLYCRYSFTQGFDWTIIHGVVEGYTQLATTSLNNNEIVWNFPIDIAYKSTNAYGWPKVTLAIFGLDWLGRDVIMGYGSFICPTTPGPHDVNVHTYAPTTTSIWKKCLNWIQGIYPEFYNYNFITQGDGRNVTNVKCDGIVINISLDVTMRNIEDFGYSF